MGLFFLSRSHLVVLFSERIAGGVSRPRGEPLSQVHIYTVYPQAFFTDQEKRHKMRALP